MPPDEPDYVSRMLQFVGQPLNVVLLYTRPHNTSSRQLEDTKLAVYISFLSSRPAQWVESIAKSSKNTKINL
jgi:hypothetical protein